jgi:hypothetical protein
MTVNGKDLDKHFDKFEIEKSKDYRHKNNYVVLDINLTTSKPNTSVRYMHQS